MLVATTIIENGLDIPNANTMIINRADRYGLAQLYQLRGRVGRSDRRAYAYLLVPPGHTLSPVARKRLAAMREFSDLGSGFRVAALDLEIRGAGNLLGGEQSGHIESIGFEMYLKLLEETIRELKGEELEDDARATVNLKVELRIDETYIPDMNQRLGVYRRMAARADRAGARGRLGRGPRPLRPAARVGDQPGGLRVASASSPTSCGSKPSTGKAPPSSLDSGPAASTRCGSSAWSTGGRTSRWCRRRRCGSTAAQPMTAPTFVAKRQGRPEPPRREIGRKTETKQASWWTQRATSGTVAPGFTREELAEADEDAVGHARVGCSTKSRAS